MKPDSAKTMHLFFAEELEVVGWAREEIAARVGEIEDAKTLAGLLLYLHEARQTTPTR
jgi:hypothetical protein